MVITMQVPAAGSGLRPVRVSLPRVDALIAEQPEKYSLPENLPPPKGVELRALRKPHAPTLRYLTKLALRCQSAEELGKKLKQRWERQHRSSASPNAEDEADLERLLGRG
jgi:hypothetical protein